MVDISGSGDPQMSLIACGLAIFFSGSATAKIVRPSQFVAVVQETVDWRYSFLLAWSTIGVELAVALLTVLWPSVGLPAVAAFVIFVTAVVSYRFGVSEQFRCACWGGRNVPKGTPPPSDYSSILGLTRLLGLNFFLVFVSTFASINAKFSVENALIAGVFAGAVVGGILALGLFVDIHRRSMKISMARAQGVYLR